MYDIDSVLNVSTLYALFMSILPIFIYECVVVYVRVFACCVCVLLRYCHLYNIDAEFKCVVTICRAVHVYIIFIHVRLCLPAASVCC